MIDKYFEIFKLTKTERAIAIELLKTRKTIKEIVADNTTDRAYVRKVLRKLGTEKREEAQADYIAYLGG